MDSIMYTHLVNQTCTLIPERNDFVRRGMSVTHLHCLDLLRKTENVKIIGILTEKPSDYNSTALANSDIALHWSRFCDFNI